MAGFKVGDRVLLRKDATFVDAVEDLRDRRIVGVVEDVFEDGDLQVRFVDGSPDDAVHWIHKEDAELAPPPAAASDDATTRERDAAITARVEAVNGFVYVNKPEEGLTGRRALAEVDKDGATWRTWDLNTVFSEAACELIAHAPSDIRYLLSALAAAERERDAAREALRWIATRRVGLSSNASQIERLEAIEDLATELRHAAVAALQADAANALADGGE